MNPKTSTARRWVGPPCSTVIRHADDVVGPGTKVYVVARKSPGKTDKRRLATQVDAVTARIRELGGVVLDTFPKDNWPGSDPTWLIPAVKEAKELGADVIVAEDSSRLIRSGNYTKDAQYWEPNRFELNWLNEIADGMTLATIVHPDAKPGERRSNSIKRGQRASGRKGGRPPKKEKAKPGELVKRRKQLQPVAHWLKVAGFSYRDIASKLDVIASTIQGWTTGVRFFERSVPEKRPATNENIGENE